MKISDTLTVRPYSFQEEGVRFILDHNYCIIGDEMGLGKSLQAIAAALYLGKRTLIVCPAYLRTNWKLEIEKLSNFFVNTATFHKSDHHRKPTKEDDFIIISYNNLAYSSALFDWADVVIADEVQYLKNMGAYRTTLFHKFLYEYIPERFIGLSGTPIKNNVTEWYSLLTMCSYTNVKNNGKDVHKAFPTQKEWNKMFSHSRFINVGYGRYIEKFEGLRNQQKLREYLRGKYIRRLAKNELELPELLRKDIVVNYHFDPGLEESWVAHQAGKSVKSGAKARSALVKAAFTARYCQDLSQESRNPILIYTDHRRSCKKISEELKCPMIWGDTSISDRDRIVKGFQRGEYKFLVATIGAAQAGYTLTAASNLVFNDLSWVPADNMQAEKRIHRIGQNKRCVIHRILGSRQDQAIVATLTEKQEVLKEAL